MNEIILIIEDDEGLIELLSEKIQENGCETSCVLSATAAIDWLKGNTPLLMLLDYRLPDMNGKELISELTSKKMSIPPFIVSTGQGDERIAVDMMKLGARDYIIKDNHFLELIPLVINRVCAEIEKENRLNIVEKALTESNQFNKQIIESAQEGVVVYDKDLNYLIWNPFMEVITGIKASDLIGKSAIDVFPFLKKVGVLDNIEKVLQGEIIPENEFEFNFPLPGKSGWVSDSLASLKNTEGEIIGAISTIRDISERKKAENELKESEIKYRELVDNSPDAITIYSEGKIIFVNNECLNLMNAESADELIGKPVMTFVHPDSHSFAQERMKKVLNGRTALPVAEEKFLRVDGSVIDVEVKSMPIEFQNKPAVQLIVTDITERKKAENELSESRANFKDLFENAPVGYHELDDKGRIVRINQTELNMLGFSIDEIMGQYIWKIIVNESESEQAVKEKLNGKLIPTLPYERNFLRKDGTTISVSIQDKVLYNKDGRITGLRSSIQDITERIEAEQNLRLSEEKFKNIFENSIVGKSLTSIEGKLSVNKAFSQIVGYSQKELSTMNWVEFTHKDDIELNKKEIESIVNRRKPYSHWEKRYIHKNGNIVWVDISTTPVNDNEGKLLYFITEIYDITKRKEAEEALQLAKESYLDIFNSVSEAIYILDENWTFIEVNKGAEKMYGFSRQELIGQSPMTVAAQGMNDMDSVIKLLQQTKETGKSANFEFWAVRKNAEVFPKEVMVNKGKYFDKDILIATARDITERKQSEKTIFENEERYRLISSVVSDYIFTTRLDDDKLGLSWVTGAFEEITGYNYDEYIAVGGWRGTLHPDDLEKDTNDLKELKRNHKVVSDIRTIKKNGECVWVRVYAHPLWDAHENKLIGIYGGVKNINESKLIEIALHESEELYRNLVLRIPDGVYKSTSDGKFIDVNPAMVKMLGYETKEELMKIDIKSQLYFDVSDRDYIQLNELNEEMSVFQLKKKDGSGIWIEDHGWYSTDNNGNITTHEGILRDITDRKNAQDSLQESERMLNKLLFANSQFIDSVSEEIDYLKMSDTMLEISGAKYATLNLMEDNDTVFRTVAVSGIHGIRSKIANLFGFDLQSKKWKLDVLKSEKIQKNNITKFDSIHELAKNVLPNSLITLIEKTFNVRESYVVKITKNNKFIGDFTLIFNTGSVMRNTEIVELFANQVGLYIDRENANIALRTSEGKYRYLFDNNPQPMYIYDMETLAFIEVNQAAINHYGYTKEEFLGMTIKDIRPAEDLPRLMEDVQIIDKSFRLSGEWRHFKKNGELINVEISLVSILLNGRNVRHALIHDITERKRAEEEIKASVSILNATLESTADGILVVNEAGFPIIFNQKFLEMWNIPHELLENRKDGDLLHAIIKQVVTPDKFVSKINDLYLTSHESSIDMIDLIDGRIFERYSIPQQIGNTIVGRVWSFRDITERKLAEIALRESEDKYRTMIDNSNDLIWALDMKGNFIFMNEIALSTTGFLFEEWIGKSFVPLIQPEDLPMIMDVFQQTTSGKRCNYELRLKKADESMLIISTNTSPIFNQGEIDGIVSFGHDITDRKLAEQALEEKMNELMRFQRLTVDRELIMIELKKEINRILVNSGQPEKYKIVE
ncbi:MAG: PAS domain S-box protein [Paludibacter sp.]|nr:PAS domain S-box protein [Paludibacter sp.]